MENPPTNIYEENHGLIFTILWEMVVSTNVNMKINAAKLLRAIVPYIDAKVASTHVLPALITLGSDQNLNVKYASIDAFGAVAQHLKMTRLLTKYGFKWMLFLRMAPMKLLLLLFVHWWWQCHIQQKDLEIIFCPRFSNLQVCQMQ
ncbi:hypothetical protein AAHE18_14G219600 [Arachis hypogaea]